jgi:hypothetical protein
MRTINSWLFYTMDMVRDATKLWEATARIAGATFLDLYMALNQTHTDISLGPWGPSQNKGVRENANSSRMLRRHGEKWVCWWISVLVVEVG